MLTYTRTQIIPLICTIGDKRMRNLTKNFMEMGLQPRLHGNTKRLPANTLTYECQKIVVTFLLNFAAQNALVLPGRVPGFQKTDIRLLPSNFSKRSIWRICKGQMEAVRDVPIGYSTFCKLWKRLVPYLVVTKPMTDLCWTCQQNSTALTQSVNTPLAEKSAALKAYLEHLEIVHKKRSYYKTVCDQCRKSIRSKYTQADQFTPPPLLACTPPNSVDIESHYSFDYAQQVSICVDNTYHFELSGCSTGTLSQQPPATRPHLLPRTKEVFSIWGML